VAEPGGTRRGQFPLSKGRSQGVCKECPGTLLGEKMAGGEYSAEK